METRAITKFIRVSPRKVRLVVDQIRGKGVEEALNILKFIPKRSAGIVAKTVRTAVANAENTQSVDVDRLFVKQAKVDEAGMWKRFMPRAQGRATRVRKRLSHVTIVVDEAAGEELTPDGSENTSENVSSRRDRDLGFEVVRAPRLSQAASRRFSRSRNF